MTLKTIYANTMRELEKEANEKSVHKEDVINVMQSSDGVFMMSYYTED